MSVLRLFATVFVYVSLVNPCKSSIETQLIHGYNQEIDMFWNHHFKTNRAYHDKWNVNNHGDNNEVKIKSSSKYPLSHEAPVTNLKKERNTIIIDVDTYIDHLHGNDVHNDGSIPSASKNTITITVLQSELACYQCNAQIFVFMFVAFVTITRLNRLNTPKLTNLESFSIISFVILIIADIGLASNNLFCNEDSWSSIEGNWTFDNKTCILNNIDDLADPNHNVVWFGSSDGSISADYGFQSFKMKALFKVNEGANAGMIFRASGLSNGYDKGTNYVVEIRIPVNYLAFGVNNNGVWTAKYIIRHNFNYNTIYELTLTAIDSFYNISVNDTILFSNIYEAEFNSGTVGILTYHSQSSFYSLTYEPINISSTPIPECWNISQIEHATTISTNNLVTDWKISMPATTDLVTEGDIRLITSGNPNDISYAVSKYCIINSKVIESIQFQFRYLFYIASENDDNPYFQLILENSEDAAIWNWKSPVFNDSNYGLDQCGGNFNKRCFSPVQNYHFTNLNIDLSLHGETSHFAIKFVNNGGSIWILESSLLIKLNWRVQTTNPTADPSVNPTGDPTNDPTNHPITDPTNDPTNDPTIDPTNYPTIDPTNYPTTDPIIEPTEDSMGSMSGMEMHDVNRLTFIAVIAMSMLFILLAIMSCIHTEFSYRNDWQICYKNGCYKSDQHNLRIICKLLLRISDLFTDIVLAYTLTLHYLNDGTDLLLILSVCSIIFIIVPYIINIIFTVQVTKLDNIIIERPTVWFSKYMFIFLFSTLLTGDCFISTQLISSNMFGLNIFNSGLNMVQFNSIKHVKIINIIAESIPQCIIQSIYGHYNGLNLLIVLSLLLSLLSSISNVLSWCFTGHIQNKYKLIQYASKVTLCDNSGEGNLKKELLQIIKYRGCTRILRNKLCLILGIEVSKLKINCVDMNGDGCNINIIQTILNQNNNSIQQFYENKYNEINNEIKKVYSLTWDVKSVLMRNDTNSVGQLTVNTDSIKRTSTPQYGMVSDDEQDNNRKEGSEIVDPENILRYTTHSYNAENNKNKENVTEIELFRYTSTAL